MNLTEKGAIQAAVSKLKFRTQAFIDGKFTDAASGKSFVTENPATGKPLAKIALCGSEDVNRAVKAARSVFEKGSWSRMHPNERKGILCKFADLLETHSDELALLECLEAGKPIQDCCTIDIPETAKCIRWHAEIMGNSVGPPRGPLGPVSKEAYENLKKILSTISSEGV